jgi:hypothetical protein
MNLRSFNEVGLREVHSLLDAMKDGGSGLVPSGLLTDDALSIDLGVDLGRVPRQFERRFDLAIWLNRQLDDFLENEPTNASGHWTWLTMLLLDILAPPRADGTRRIGERARYVLESDNWQRFYRHLLAGPAKVMRAHWNEPHITRAILAGRPDSPGDLYEQIASRQEVITSPVLVRLTKDLYWDDGEKALKRGAAGKGQGSARRLARVMLQLDLTWDLAEMSDEALLALIPEREFRRFAGTG